MSRLTDQLAIMEEGVPADPLPEDKEQGDEFDAKEDEDAD